MPIPALVTAAVLAASILAALSIRGDSAGPVPYDRATALQGGEVILANGGSTANGDLEGEWTVALVTNGTIAPGATATLAFAAGEVTGFAGCNYFWTKVVQMGDETRFAPVSADPLVCSSAVMEMETAILRAIGTVTGYRIGTDGAVTFLSGDMPALTVVRAP